MPNKELKHKSYKLSDKVINRIKHNLATIKITDVQSKGVKRAQDMIDKKIISYGHANRLKNYFDTYEGDGTDDEYKLIGGELTKKWLDNTLEHDKSSIKKRQEIKMNSNDPSNVRNKEGLTRDRDNANPTKANGGMINPNKSFKKKNIMSNTAIYQESYNKEIDSIKYLMEYMNKK